MEQLLSPEHGVSALLAGIAILLAIHVARGFFDKKEKLTDQAINELKKSVDRLRTVLAGNIETTIRLEEQMKGAIADREELQQLKEHLKKTFIAVRLVAGDKWPKIKAQVFDEDIPK